jgi:Tol biopolymer transport system component/DNA-binding winged helix-turn-helix (wHTH) protein
MGLRSTHDFGRFHLDTESRVLTRDGVVVPIAPRTFDLLAILVTSKGRLLSKDDLLRTIWGDVNVEEASLAFQVSSLRKLLGDEGSAWIETVPKHGYRFAGTAVAVAEEKPAPPLAPKRGLPLLVASVIVAAAVVALLVLIRGRADRERPAPKTATPLTAYPGIQAQPSLSPDGSHVAFTWTGPDDSNYDIYIKLVGPGEPVRLTTAPERDVAPSWSPDGRQIAFVRYISRQHASVIVIPALGGGVEYKVADLFLSLVGYDTTLSWTADSKQIAVSGRFRESAPFGLWLVPLDGGPPRRLTNVGSEASYDAAPAFSPDRKRLAFIRAISPTRTRLFVLPLTEQLQPSGAPLPVTDGKVAVHGIAWMDDRRIVYSTGGYFARHLGILDLDSGGTTGVEGFGEGAASLSIAPNGTLVYERESAEVNLWRFGLIHGNSAPERLAPSTYETWTPAYSHDGRRIAFATTRSGLEEVWIADSDGAHPIQLTRMGSGHTANARWSLDDRAILFNSWSPRSDLYTVAVSDGTVKRLTDQQLSNSIEPSWSRDGRWIYFGDDRTGRFEVDRIPVGGGATEQLTHNGGLHAEESVDRKWVYYSKDAESPSSIWRVPRDGGQETLMIDGLSYSTNFMPTEKGIYFISAEHEWGPANVEFYDFATARRKVLFAVQKPFTWGLALSPDGRWLVHGLEDHVSSNLMLIEDLR